VIGGGRVLQKNIFILLILVTTPVFLPSGIQARQGDTTGDIYERCRECRLFLTNNENLQGRLINLNREYLEIEFHEMLPKQPFKLQTHQQTIPVDEILFLQCGDRSYDGAIWGFVICGLTTAFFAGAYVSGTTPPGHNSNAGEIAGLGLLIGGGAGSVIGYFIDAVTGYRIETKEIHEWLGEDER
jgi:hypothetical protein